MNNYPANLIDNQWQVIEKFLDAQERKRKCLFRQAFLPRTTSNPQRKKIPQQEDSMQVSFYDEQENFKFGE